MNALINVLDEGIGLLSINGLNILKFHYAKSMVSNVQEMHL